MASSGNFLRLLNAPGVMRLIPPMVLARLPIGATTVLLVLFASLHLGAFQAGLACSMMTLGAAIASPILGRFVDRGHGPITLGVSAALQLALILILVTLVQMGADAPAVAIVSFLSGVSTPPVAGTTRALWPHLVPDDLLAAAYSFEVGLIDVLYVTGPLVASVFIAVGKPEVGLVFVAAGQLVGALWLSMSSPVRDFAASDSAGPRRLSDSEAGGSHSMLFVTPGVGLLLFTCLATNGFSGALETILPLWCSHVGQPNASAVIIAIWSAGSIMGVVAFARFQPSKYRFSLAGQLCVATAVYFLATLLCSLHDEPAMLAFGAAIIGLAVSPCTNLHYQLSSALAPRSRHAEMFSWVNTATSAGLSLGAFCVGIAVDALGFDAAFALNSAFVLVALGFALALKRRTGGSSAGPAGS